METMYVMLFGFLRIIASIYCKLSSKVLFSGA